MVDAIIISDIHLGSHICQDEKLLKFLSDIERYTNKLIINGDLFDDWNFKNLNENHWRILKTIRKISNKISVIWISGNHDGPAHIISNLIGVEFVESYIMHSFDKKIICLHGDIFDDFIEKYPLITKIADKIYRFIQWLDPSFYLPRLLKRSSKTFLRATEKIRDRAIVYAKKHNADIICVGHTHSPLTYEKDSVKYVNSGSWTSDRCSYISLNKGLAILKYYES
jgi:UDP-2,3-diacylglucosamine pyrophosphatase LpxH